jgi:hypothetical protein
MQVIARHILTSEDSSRAEALTLVLIASANRLSSSEHFQADQYFNQLLVRSLPHSFFPSFHFFFVSSRRSDAPFCSCSQAPFTDEKYGTSTDGQPSTTEMQAALQASSVAIRTLLRSWPGIMCLTASQYGLRTLIEELKLSPNVAVCPSMPFVVL